MGLVSLLMTVNVTVHHTQVQSQDMNMLAMQHYGLAGNCSIYGILLGRWYWILYIHASILHWWSCHYHQERTWMGKRNMFVLSQDSCTNIPQRPGSLYWFVQGICKEFEWVRGLSHPNDPLMNFLEDIYIYLFLTR